MVEQMMTLVGEGIAPTVGLLGVLIAILGVLILQTVLLSRLLREVFLARIVPEVRRLNTPQARQGSLECEMEQTDSDYYRDISPLLRRNADRMKNAA